MQQTKKKVAPGDEPGGGLTPAKGGLKRLAPESKGLLKEIDTSLTKAKQKSSLKESVRDILDRCGC